MSSGSVKAWLAQLGLDRYAPLFEENDIDWSLLTDVDNQTLKDVGIESAGDRLRLTNAIAQLRPQSPNAPSASGTSITGQQPERRQLTVMFCDLVRSSALAARLDPEDWRDVVRAYQKAAAEIVQRYEGHVAQYLGDGLLVYFGYPSAHEDDALRAVHTGLGIVRQIGQLNIELERNYAVELAVRIGIHTGPVVVGEIGSQQRKESLAIGQTPNIAARLQSIAAPGRIVVSNDTRRLLRHFFELAEISNDSNGKSTGNTPSAFEIIRERLVETRFAARATDRSEMVGRASELESLREHWRKARGGQGQVILLGGEAGIGKSRIVSALVDELDKDNHYRVVYQCSPYHSGTPLYPTAQYIAFAAQFASDDSAEQKLDKLEAIIQLGSKNTAHSASLLAALVGIGPAAEQRYGKLALPANVQREQTMAALVAELEGAASNRPILFVVEDIHWIDPTTLELISSALEITSSLPLMIILTTRSDVHEHLTGHSSVVRMALNRLERDSIARIVRNVTGGKPVPDDLIDFVATKTDGVPLYVEEFTKNLLESGELIEVNGHYVYRGQLNRLSVPSSLQDSLMARLDRLHSVKAVAQAGACIGRQFSYEMLLNVLTLTKPQLDAALNQLLDTELAHRTGAAERRTYRFKHALVRDAAHDSLMKSERVRIHNRIFDAYSQDGNVAPEVLALHAYEATLSDEAMRYWELAGDQAIGRSAFPEALGHYGRAEEVAESGQIQISREHQLELKMKHSRASLVANGYAHTKTVHLFSQARQISDDTPASPHRIPILWAIWTIHYVGGDHASALPVAQQMCSEVQQGPNQRFFDLSLRLRGHGHYMMGDLARAEQDLQLAFDRYDPATNAEYMAKFNSDSTLARRVFLAQPVMLRGDASRSLKILDGVEQRAMTSKHTAAAILAIGLLTQIHLYARTDARERLIQATETISAENGFKMWHGGAALYKGLHQHDLGNHDQTIAMLQTARERLGDTGTGLYAAVMFATMASSLGALGQQEKAAAAQKTALSLIDNGSEQWAAAEIHRLIAAHQYWHLGNLEKAQAHLQSATSIARNQGAFLWTLRTAITDAQIGIDRGERERAHQALRIVVESAPVGAEALRDMTEAKNLLSTLTA